MGTLSLLEFNDVTLHYRRPPVNGTAWACRLGLLSKRILPGANTRNISVFLESLHYIAEPPIINLTPSNVRLYGTTNARKYQCLRTKLRWLFVLLLFPLKRFCRVRAAPPSDNVHVLLAI